MRKSMKTTITKYFLVFTLIFINGCVSYVYNSEIYGPYKDNGILIRKNAMANDESATLIAYNKNLEKVWEVKEEIKFATSQYNMYNYLELDNGGFMGLGTLRYVDGSYVHFNPLVLYYDKNGKRIEKDVIKQNGVLYNAIKLPDGDYVACGRQWLKRGEKGIVLRFSPHKNVKWFKIIPESGIISQILLTNDNNILLVGNSFTDNNKNEKLFVGKYSLSGTKIWELISDIADGDEFVGTSPSIIMTGKGDYIIVGTIMLGGKDNKNLFYTFISKSGRIKWEKIVQPKHSYKLSIGPRIYDIHLLPNKSFLVAGCWKIYSNDGFLSKMDLDGNEIWTIDILNNGKKRVPQYISKNIDGSYTVYGFSKVSGNDEEIWSLKLNKNGEVVSK